MLYLMYANACTRFETHALFLPQSCKKKKKKKKNPPSNIDFRNDGELGYCGRLHFGSPWLPLHWCQNQRLVSLRQKQGSRMYVVCGSVPHRESGDGSAYGSVHRILRNGGLLVGWQVMYLVISWRTDCVCICFWLKWCLTKLLPCSWQSFHTGLLLFTVRQGWAFLLVSWKTAVTGIFSSSSAFPSYISGVHHFG